MRLLRLSDVPTGKTFRIVRIDGVRGLMRRRIMEVGLVPGALVRVVRRSLMNYMVNVEVGSSSVAIRGDVASRILVEEVRLQQMPE